MDLTQYIPQKSKTVNAIFDWHKKKHGDEKPRTYLGASIIGAECERYLWYNFRWACKPEFPGRIYRLFETGHLEEPRMVEELRGIGCEIHPFDPETGEQFGVSAIGGHFKGHMDGVGLGIIEAPKTWHVLEFKTHNDKSFKKFVKEGVEKSKPQHFAQTMVYMRLTGMTRALYEAKNKNDDDLHSERIRYDAPTSKRYMDKALRVITAQSAPLRIANRPDSFMCRFCYAYNICWGITTEVAVPIPWKSCRTCCHATPEIDEGEDWGRWSCAKHRKDITPQEQFEACPSHLLLPDFVTFAEPVDATDDGIEFKNEDGTIWHHGGLEDKGWSTEELMGSRGPLDKQKLPFEPIEGLSLLDQFEGAETIFEGNRDTLEGCLESIGIVQNQMADLEEDHGDYGIQQYGDYLLLISDKQFEIRKGVK